EEDTVGLLEHRQLFRVLALLAGLEREDPDLRGPEVAEQLLVAPSGGAQLRSGRRDRDPSVAPAAQLHEALEDRLGADLVLGAADRNDEAALLAFGHSRWAHGASSLTRLSVARMRFASTSLHDQWVTRFPSGGVEAAGCKDTMRREPSKTSERSQGTGR